MTVERGDTAIPDSPGNAGGFPPVSGPCRSTILKVCLTGVCQRILDSVWADVHTGPAGTLLVCAGAVESHAAQRDVYRQHTRGDGRTESGLCSAVRSRAEPRVTTGALESLIRLYREARVLPLPISIPLPLTGPPVL
ncbi:MAG: hypothetical protein MZV64_31605 [Ignavibacteriales bacterium]|nr:hypothetical protein [Ignavibacteriales bacterium]